MAVDKSTLDTARTLIAEQLPDNEENLIAPGNQRAADGVVLDIVESELNRVEALIPSEHIPAQVSNLESNQSAILQQIVTMGERVTALEQAPAIATDPDGSPGSPLEAVSPIGPTPRPQGGYTYNDFTSHYFSDNGGSHRHQSNFNIRTSVSGWYKYEFKGFIAHPNSGIWNEIIQVRERDGLWYFIETTANAYVEDIGGTLPKEYIRKGQIGLNANTDYTVVLYGSNNIPSNTDTTLKQGFFFEYDLELVSQFVNPDYKRPETWGHIHAYMEATGRKTSRGDMIYIMRSNRPNATTSTQVPGPILTAGQTVRILWYNGSGNDIVKVYYDTDGDGFLDVSVLMTMRNDEDGQVWDFAGRPVTLDGDYWTAEYTPDTQGRLIFDAAMLSASEGTEFAAFIVD